MSEPAEKTCPICGETLIRVRLFDQEWWECPQSVLEGLLPIESILEITPDHVRHDG